GVRLVIPDRALGSPVLRTLSLCTCCRHYPGAAAGRIICSFTQPYQPSPKGLSGRPAHRPFRDLLGVHSRYGLHTRAVTVYRDTLTRGFSHFVTSMTAPVASGWSGCRVGLTPTGKRRLSTAHTQSRHQRQRPASLAAVGHGRIDVFDCLLRCGPRVSDSVRLGVEHQLLRSPVQQLADPEHVLGRAGDLVDPAELLQLLAALAEHTQHSAVER